MLGQNLLLFAIFLFFINETEQIGKMQGEMVKFLRLKYNDSLIQVINVTSANMRSSPEDENLILADFKAHMVDSKKNHQDVDIHLIIYPDLFKEDTMRSDQPLKRENKFHESILPMLVGLENRFPSENNESLFISVLKNGTVSLEDEENYKRVGLNGGLDLKYFEAALKMLGKYHAMTAVLYERKQFINTVFEKSPFDWEQTYPKIFYERFLNSFASSLNCELWGPDWKKIQVAVNALTSNISYKMEEALKYPKNRFHVLNNGAFHVYNLRFNEPDCYWKPIVVKLDVATHAFVNSPAWDLISFVYTSIKPEFMSDEYQERMLKFYHKNLLTNLNHYEYNGQPPTFEFIQEEFKRLRFIGIILAITDLCTSLISPTEKMIMIQTMIDTPGKTVNEMCLQGKNYTSTLTILLTSYIKSINAL